MPEISLQHLALLKPKVKTVEGPEFRYFLPEAGEWKAVESWPPPDSSHREFALRADGGLATDEGEPGSREYMTLGEGLNRARPSAIDPPSMLSWTSAPLEDDLDVAGDIELRLVASATASDTGWINTIRSSSRLLLPVLRS